MNKNFKRLFLLTTVLMLLAAISAVSAVDDDSAGDVAADTAVVVDDSASDVADVAVSTDKNIDKNIQTKEVKKDATTHIVNQDNVEDIFNGDGHTLGDSVSEGDTLDFQGTIDKEHSIVINKPINVVSSTKDAVINLHTVAGSLMGEDPGNSFVINIGASGSNISSLYLYNTECWVHNVYNAVLYNMTMHVENARVGSGVGQTSLRYCNNVTMDSCHIYTENNGGSSSFVWTGCNNCTIVNSTVQGEGNVGNLLYVGNQFNTNDKPANYTITNFDNNIINCTVLGGSGGINNPLQNMATRTLIKGNKFYCGGSASSGTNGTFIDNEFYRTVSVSVSANGIATGNAHYGNGTVTIAANSTVTNNTFYNATISGAGVTFENNTVLSRLNVNQPTNVKNSNLNNINVASNGKGSNITNNNITGTVTSAADNVTIDSNNITTTNDYAVVVTGATNTVTNNILLTSTKAGDDTLNVKADTTVDANTPEAGAKFVVTDETYSNFFDEHGVLSNENVTDYSTLTFQGPFFEKIFIINKVLTLNSQDAVITNGFIVADEGAIISVENFTFNNTKVGNDNTILLRTDGNLVRNNKFYRTSNNGPSHEVMVEGDNNIIIANTFDLAIPVLDIDYSQYPFAMSEASAISVTGSNNNINKNNIKVVNTTSDAGTISVIDLASKTASSYNQVINNTIVASSSGYLYGVNLGANTDRNTINQNKITMDSGYYTAGIQIGYSPAYNNTIYQNVLNLSSPVSYGILASAYGGEVAGTTINNNTVIITANQLAAVELCGASPELIKDTIINNTRITANGNYTVGIGVAGSNLQVSYNNMTIVGTTNSSDEGSYDLIKPTTAGIIIKDSNNVIAYNNTLDVTNGADIILNGTNDTKIMSTLTVASRFINAKNNANIVLSNSNNNLIDTQKAFTTGAYSIELTNSSNNNITNNILNASNIKGGNGAVLMDEASVDNYLFNNTPNFGLLTDETYSSLFDENGVYTFPEGVDILTLAGDLHNKDLIFTNNLTFTNAGDYTIYNGTIILSDVEGENYTDRFVYFRNINVNNTDKPVFVDNMTQNRQRNVEFTGGVFAVYGDEIVAFESVKDITSYTILDVSDATVIVNGSDATAFKFNRDTYIRQEYLDVERCNITVDGTDSSVVFDVLNTNLDMLRNNILQHGGQVQTLNAKDVYANSQFFMNNNITAVGDSLSLINLKDNYGSNPTFGNNSIIAISSNPVSVMNISNATNVYVGQGQYSYASYNTPNHIVINAENKGVPVIFIDSKGYVRNNYILAMDVYGDAAVSAQTVSNNTPFATTVKITSPDVLYVNGANTIKATATGSDKKVATGRFVFYAGEEEIASSTGSEGVCTYTPTTLDDVEVTVVFVPDASIYLSSSNTTTFSVLPNEAIITVDEITADAGTTVTLKANVKDLTGNGINKGKVTFKVNGKTVKDVNGKVVYAKVVDGVASVEYEVPESWTGQNYTITAIFAGSSDLAKAQNTSKLFVNNNEDESITFENEPVTAKVGQTVTFTVKVNTDASKVVIKVNGKSLKDANGKVIYAKVVDGIATIEYTIPENMKAKEYNLTAVSLGSERLTAEQKLTITE